MSLWRQLARGMRVLSRRRSADNDVSDEVQHYLEQVTAEFLRRGLNPRDARRAAQIEIGNATVTRERVRSYGWENAIGELLGDLRFALRRFAPTPDSRSSAPSLWPSALALARRSTAPSTPSSSNRFLTRTPTRSRRSPMSRATAVRSP
jgi:hypothetical protein